MPCVVDFNAVSTVGLESWPVAAALAGLRAHEARYFKNKYDHVFTGEAASKAKTRLLLRELEPRRELRRDFHPFRSWPPRPRPKRQERSWKSCRTPSFS